MIERILVMKKRQQELNELLTDPNIASNIKLMTSYSKELKELERPIFVSDEIEKLKKNILDLKEMKKESDPDLLELVEADLIDSEDRLAKLEEELNILLLPKDPNDDKNCIMEIRGAVGGDEANIFAGDLFRMYSKYAESKGWKIEVFDTVYGTSGGFSSISFKVIGDNIYSFLKYESGGHRVQRVPETESQGRIHTSVAVVLCLPEQEDIDFDLDPNDIRIDTFCSSGPGGQSVNTTKSAVRATHIPTGIAVASQVYKSQHENKAAAINLLKSRIYNSILEEQAKKDDALRKSLVGHGQRSEKIRTYNYPQNRVTDHRIGFSINRLDAIIDGKCDLVIDELINYDQKQKLSGHCED